VPVTSVFVFHRLNGVYSNLCPANYGFSLGINDVIPGPILASQKDALVEKAYQQCLELINLAKLGKLENKAGCNQEQTLEAMISSVLSQVRDQVGDICMKELSKYNAPLIMATCGSKGMIDVPTLMTVL
jgi:DNA-directed RNA polymerase III subunit RPC1